MIRIQLFCFLFRIRLSRDGKKQLHTLLKEWKNNCKKAEIRDMVRAVEVMPQGLKGFVQNNVENGDVIRIYDLLCRFTPVPGKYVARNLTHNLHMEKAAELPDLSTTGYLEKQALWKDIHFGKSSIAYSGCEIMAVYNTLKALGEKTDYSVFCHLISGFEKKGAALWGKFGVSPGAIYRSLLKQGYETVFCTCEGEEELLSLQEKYPVYIVTVYNSKTDITEQIHTVCICKVKNQFVVHNASHAYGRTYSSLPEAIDNITGMSPKPMSIIGIKHR